ncbi:7TM diverse intracellular signaling domain-containing protein [Pontibacter silvestris]|uniref:histidine kinase n=1 Tax=Pontibacter silvestris TaxID=2305183 RepID=A0ABW4X196_9BACT|nr:7TM diverse intracellular signaling domain-containing protein [Pontibacter silvestris]MCC9135893.1 histidine kinase [Pontibacter silvestris]
MTQSFDTEFIFKCFFEGVLFAQLVYVVFHLCVHNNRRDYLYYLLYLLSSVAYFLYKDFMFYKLGWKYGGYPYPHNGLNYVLANIMHFTYLKFVKHFIGTKKKYPYIHRVAFALTRFIMFFIILNILSMIFFKTLVPAYVQYVYSGTLAIVTFALIYRMFLRRNTLINYIIFGSVMYALCSLISLVVAVAHMNGYLPTFEGSLTIVQIGVMLEVLCFTAGLAHKSVIVETERNLSQQRLLQEMERNKKLDEDLQHIRDKISQDLHDDIGATLTAISVYSDVAQKYHQRENPQGVLDMLNQIGGTARQMVNDMRDIVWMINPKNDELSALLDKIHIFASTIVLGKDIRLHFAVAQEIKDLRLNMQMRRDMYLVVKEGVTNVVKHSECRNLWISFIYEREYILLVVKDDGKGFSLQEGSRGNGIYNIEKRARHHNGKLSIKSDALGSTLECQFELK